MDCPVDNYFAAVPGHINFILHWAQDFFLAVMELNIILPASPINKTPDIIDGCLISDITPISIGTIAREPNRAGGIFIPVQVLNSVMSPCLNNADDIFPQPT